MRKFLKSFLLALLVIGLLACSSTTVPVVRLTAPTYVELAPNSLRIFCYHDIRDNLQDTFKTKPDASAVDTKAFTEQLSWLYHNGWVSVGIDELIASRNGGKALPPKAFMLTFDDGYKSHYTHVYPLLKAFNFKAVYGIVGEWMQDTNDGLVNYSDQRWSRKEFLTWPQVNEMVKSGLVEVASHSHSMHKGLAANPQGNLEPSAVTRQIMANWLQTKTANYEDDIAYHMRIKSDLAAMNALIKQNTGTPPRAVIWPYGRYNYALLNSAKEESLPVAFSLTPGLNLPSTPLNQLKREHVLFNTGLGDFINSTRTSGAFMGNTDPLRVMHVDLDYIYDADPEQQERNLSKLLNRVVDLKPSTVFLQAFSDPDGDGSADALYFPNRVLPMRADLFNRVSWQLSTRTGVRVFAWMPVTAFNLAGSGMVTTAKNKPQNTTAQKTGKPDGKWPLRASVFDPKAKEIITQIYEDLGKSAPFAGVLFHDDGVLTDDEDASPAAIAAYAKAGLSTHFATIRKDSAQLRKWSLLKAKAITDFTVQLIGVLKHYQPDLLTARNLFARPVLDENAVDTFSQSYQQYLDTYDYTALMAMPYLEKVNDPNQWLRDLTDKVALKPNGLNRTIFELQSKDWNSGKKIDERILSQQFQLLRTRGVRNLAYYPDDFISGHPAIDGIKDSFSLRTEPVKR
jgi:poly-beta-1,6-N-acetyl-D-glucosamine N-deacetylase